MANGSESQVEVDELDPEVGLTESEQEAAAGAHTPVSYTIPTASTQDGGGGEGSGDEFGFGFGPFSVSFETGEAGDESGEAGDESQFETVEGWDESSLTEAGASDEATLDAWYAEATDEDQKEFFAFLAPLVPLLVKSVVPALASAAAQNLPRLAGSILQRIGKPKVRVRRRESGDEAFGVDEAALEAAAQQLEQIVDVDDRVQVTNTSAVPWKRICFLEITAKNGKKFIGSGALVAPRTVITAGHCVYMHTQGGWPASITVTPGRNGSEMPFGQASAVGLRSVNGWVSMHKREYDYGAIILPPSYTRDQSAFGFASMQDAALRGKKLNHAGYSGDKPRGTLWYSGRIARAITQQTLVYNAATMGGDSGSPVWIKQAGKRVMVGIHTNGWPTGNSATRITSVVAENLRRWANEGGRQLPVATRRIGMYRTQRVPTTQRIRTPEEVTAA
jgi:V8-like Glu-specific endopeptidase